MQTLSPDAKIARLEQNYYLTQPILKEQYDDYARCLKELEQVPTMARRYRKLRNFLDDLALDPPLEHGGRGGRGQAQ